MTDIIFSCCFLLSLAPLASRILRRLSGFRLTSNKGPIHFVHDVTLQSPDSVSADAVQDCVPVDVPVDRTLHVRIEAIPTFYLTLS